MAFPIRSILFPVSLIHFFVEASVLRMAAGIIPDSLAFPLPIYIISIVPQAAVLKDIKPYPFAVRPASAFREIEITPLPFRHRFQRLPFFAVLELVERLGIVFLDCRQSRLHGCVIAFHLFCLLVQFL